VSKEHYVDDNGRKITIYLRDVFHPGLLYSIAKRLQRDILKSRVKFDVIVGSGFGGLVVPVLAIEMIRPFAMVRKSDETHSENIVEGMSDADDYIIVDDSIWEGNTVKRIISQIGRKPVAAFLYNDNLKQPAPWADFPVHTFYWRNRNES
jgi:orotate phosphoribosyltransferase